MNNRFLKPLRLGTLVLVAAAATSVGEGWAGEEEDRVKRSNATIERCVEEEFQAERDGMACIGRFANPCAARNDMQSTEEQTECIERELVLWSKLLRAEYRGLLTLLGDEETRERLGRAQRLWTDFHKTNCRLPYRLYRAETVGRTNGAYCSMRLTAYRALELRGWRKDIPSILVPRVNDGAQRPSKD